jgi:hypothetical protein
MRPRRGAASGVELGVGPILGAALGVLIVAVLARWVVLPLERHVFDGHEALYLKAFLGENPPTSAKLMPLPAALLALFGRLGQDPETLLHLHLGLGVVCVVLGGLAAARGARPIVGIFTGALLATAPAHVAWSASAYNVILPQTLLMGALAVGGLRGAPLYALACACRVELALFAPAVALIGGWRLAIGALGALIAAPTLLDGGGPPLRPLGVVLPANLSLSALAGPVGTLPGLAAVAFAAPRSAWRPLAAGVLGFVAMACFDDLGDRHLLFPAFCLFVAAARAEGLWRLGLAALLGLQMWGLGSLCQRFYATAEVYRATVPAELPTITPPLPCVELLDDPIDPRSHWNHRGLWWGHGDWPQADGVQASLCWGEEAAHWAWTNSWRWSGSSARAPIPPCLSRPRSAWPSRRSVAIRRV